jgi:ABC-type phosphate transport system permease subunit
MFGQFPPFGAVLGAVVLGVVVLGVVVVELPLAAQAAPPALRAAAATIGAM